MASAGRGVPDVFDLAVRADQERTADDSFENAAHEFLGPPRTIGFDHFVIRIAEQREIQFLFGAEFCLGRFAVGAGTENHYIKFVEVLSGVTKLGRFGGSTGRVGLGIEKHDNALSGEVLQRDVFPFVGFQLKRGSLVSNFKHCVLHQYP